MSSDDEAAVRTLYRRMLDGWNIRSGKAFAAVFADDGELIEYDGTQHIGRDGIAHDLEMMFEKHPSEAYVGKVRRVRLTGSGAVLLAVAGMLPPGGVDIDPRLNAIQSLIAEKQDDQWKVVLFQSTPAQFHGRPKMARKLTEELRRKLKSIA